MKNFIAFCFIILGFLCFPAAFCVLAAVIAVGIYEIALAISGNEVSFYLILFSVIGFFLRGLIIVIIFFIGFVLILIGNSIYEY